MPFEANAINVDSDADSGPDPDKNETARAILLFPIVIEGKSAIINSYEHNVAG